MIWLSVLIIAVAGQCVSDRQNWYTKSGSIRFESRAPLENIEATNRSVTVIFKPTEQRLQFSVQMRGFEFRKALMQEHFNENYVESHKYPQSTFDGRITMPSQIDPGFSQPQKVQVKGQLTLHGVTRELETMGEISRENDKLRLASQFNLQLSDYKISIPSLVKDKVSNSVTVHVDCLLQPL